MKKLFKVSYGTKVAGSCDYTYVLADNEEEAFRVAKPMLDTHKLIPNFLNKYGRYDACEV